MRRYGLVSVIPSDVRLANFIFLLTTVCPKVAYNSFHMVFSAISGWILKPFDLQVATMCGFDIMYDKPVLPSKVPQCKWITFRHYLEKIRFSENLTPTVWRFR